MENEKITLKDIIKLIVGAFGALCMFLVLYHVIAPREWWIEGFYGMPLFICMTLGGYAFAMGLEEI